MNVKAGRFDCFWMPAFVALCAMQFGVAAVFGLRFGLRPADVAGLAAHTLGPRYYELLFVLAVIGALVARLARRTGASRGCAFLAGIVPLWDFVLHWLYVIALHWVKLAPLYTFPAQPSLWWGTVLPAACLVLGAYVFSFFPARPRANA